MARSKYKFLTAGPAGTLEGCAQLPDDEPRAVALVAHPLPTEGGSMENKVVTTLANTLVELGCATLCFNFRSVGGSAGEFTGGDGEVDDLLAVAQFARDQFGPLPLVLAGFSFGAYVAARAARQLDPAQLVLIAPAVQRFAMPPVAPSTLVIHGELDEVIPLADALNWARPQHLPITVLPDTGHFFHQRLTLLAGLVSRHFSGTPLPGNP